jgi:hypothetical protein
VPWQPIGQALNLEDAIQLKKKHMQQHDSKHSAYEIISEARDGRVIWCEREIRQENPRMF